MNRIAMAASLILLLAAAGCDRAEPLTAEKAQEIIGDFTAKVTDRGFRILGTAPSARGPAFRAKICEKVYEGLRNFVRHPNEATVGHAELVWHYANPTPLYPMFETAINKPLDKPFATHVSFWHEENQWKFSVNIRKAESGAAVPAAVTPASRRQ